MSRRVLGPGEHQQAVDELLAPVDGLGDRRSHLLQLRRETSGSLRATSISVRMMVSGVRSSCEALATNSF